MRIRMADGSSMRAEDYYDRALDQWIEQTPEAERTFESFRSFVRLAGFAWSHEWMIDRWDELQTGVAEFGWEVA